MKQSVLKIKEILSGQYLQSTMETGEELMKSLFQCQIKDYTNVSAMYSNERDPENLIVHKAIQMKPPHPTLVATIIFHLISPI